MSDERYLICGATVVLKFEHDVEVIMFTDMAEAEVVTTGEGDERRAEVLLRGMCKMEVMRPNSEPVSQANRLAGL